MSSASPSASPTLLDPSDRYRQAGMFALFGALLLTVHAVSTAVGSVVPMVLELAPFFLCAAVVNLGITIVPVRGRNLSIALGMIGAVAGLTGALSELIQDKPGPFFLASLILAFAGALIVGLSFPKPRKGYPQYAVYAALSGAALLALIGAIGILDDAYPDLGYLAPAVAWALLGRVVLGAEPLPPQPRPTPRARPAGSPPAARKPRQKRKPKRR
jgi:hypothetical protein